MKLPHKITLLAAPLLVLTLYSGCGSDSSSDLGGGSPAPGITPRGEIQGVSNFAYLIQMRSQGQARVMPWAGTWWPYSDGGISQAAAKYESAGGQSGAVAWEESHHGPGVPGIQDWWGHCNGWAAAAALYQEPRSAANVGGVNFSVADQKALLSEVAMEVSADYFGHRNDDNNPASPDFQDVYPDQFFLVLTNLTGSGRPLMIDRYTGDQVWNQPVAGYKIAPVQASDYLGADPSAPNVFRVNVTMQVWWVRDDVEAGHLTEPFQFQDGPSYQSRVFRAEIWLDAPAQFDSSGKLTRSGNVVLTRQANSYVLGGDWKNGDLDLLNSHPDYIWIPYSVTPSTGVSNPQVDVRWLESHFAHRN